MDKDESGPSVPAAVEVETITPGERVFTEPIDEYGIILLETRIAADGTKRTRKITRKGWPVLTVEERMAMDDPLPPEPDCWA